jgi:hypothetical protein
MPARRARSVSEGIGLSTLIVLDTNASRVKNKRRPIGIFGHRFTCVSGMSGSVAPLQALVFFTAADASDTIRHARIN